MNTSMRTNLAIFIIVACVSSIALAMPRWTTPVYLTESGNAAGSVKSLSDGDGRSIVIWWDQGENSLKSTKVGAEGPSNEIVLHQAPLASSYLEFEAATDASLTRIVVLLPGVASGEEALHLVRSDDGGSTWSAPIRVSTRLLQARLLASSDLGRLIVVGVRESGSSRSFSVIRSVDGGATWSEPQILAPEGVEWQNGMVVTAADASLQRVGIFLSYSRSQSTGAPARSLHTAGFVSSDSGASWQTGLGLSGWAIRNVRFLSDSTAMIASFERYEAVAPAGVYELGLARVDDLSQSWSTPVRIDSRDHPGASEMVLSADGSTLALAWISRHTQPAQSLVNVAVSSDRGASWGSTRVVGSHIDETNIPFAGLSISADGYRLGLAWSTFINGFDSYNQLRTATSSDMGVTWTTPELHSRVDVRTSRRRPEVGLSMSSSGMDLDLSWIDSGNLMARASGNAGKEWSELTHIAKPIFPPADLRILRVSENEIIASWLRNRAPSSHLQVAQSSDGGITWSKPFELSEMRSLGWGSDHEIAAGGGVVLAVWKEEGVASQPFRIARSFDSGRSWARSALDILPPTARLLDLRVAKLSGHATLFFEESIDGSVEIKTSVSTDHGQTWSKPSRLAARMRLVDVAVSDTGQRLHAALKAYAGSGSGPQILTSADGGHSWGVGYPIPSNPRAVFVGKFHTSGDGMHAVFASSQWSGIAHYLVGLYSLDGGSTWRTSLSPSIPGTGTWHVVATGSDDGLDVNILWVAGGDVFWSATGNAGMSWTDPAPLPALNGVSLVLPSSGPLLESSSDGNYLTTLALVGSGASSGSSALIDLVTSSSTNRGANWSPRHVLVSGSRPSEFVVDASDDGVSATALWITESGRNGARVQVSVGVDLDSYLFGSGFEP